MPFKINESYIDQLSRSPEIRKIVVDKAEQIAQAARDSAPVDTGEYRNNINVVVKYQKRVVAVVLSSDPKTMIIESKTGNLVRALNKIKRSRG